MEGRILIINKSLYELKSSGAHFHEHLSATSRRMGFKPSKADANLWMKDCGTHYEYLARYIDDILVWSNDPMTVIGELRKAYMLKDVGSPEYFLGATLKN